MPPLVIAIDGPSGSGKSSTATALATRLGIACLDTGSMYRAIALGCMAGGLVGSEPDSCDVDGVVGFTARAALLVGTDPAHQTISLNGVDVTDDVRLPEVSAQVSKVATIQIVRDILTAQMRRIVQDTAPIVVEGRDITTVVCPDAPVRILLVADQNARLARRNAQVGGTLSDDALRDQVVRRDRADATMSSFEQPAAGVTLIDSTHLNIEQVVDIIVKLVEDAQAQVLGDGHELP